MKAKILALAAIGLAPAAFGQVGGEVAPLHSGDSVLIAGFGFDQLPFAGTTYDGGFVEQRHTDALYTDLYNAGDRYLTEFRTGSFNPYATMYWDGTNGSSNFYGGAGIAVGDEPTAGSWIVAGGSPNETVNTVRRTSDGDILNGIGLETQAFLLGNGAPGYYQDQTVMALRFDNQSTFSIVVNTTAAFEDGPNSGIGGIDLNSLSFSAQVLDLALEVTRSARINWSVSTNGGASYQSAGFTDIAGAFAAKTVDLSSFLSGGETVTIVGQIEGTSDDVLFLDNIQLLGNVVEPLAAIPEPSTYAGLAGIAMLGLVAIRRRKIVC